MVFDGVVAYTLGDILALLEEWEREGRWGTITLHWVGGRVTLVRLEETRKPQTAQGGESEHQED